MAKKEISILIKARNMLAAGLASAGASLKRFGQSAARIGKMFAKGFIAAGAALTAFAVKGLTAYAVQEKAEKSAEAALRAYGDEIENNLANIKRFAAAIQDETGIGDENLISRAARLRLLGVEADQLEAATKATIALGKAGMDEEQAMKAVALAMEGDFMQLQRYLPALKTATSEAEKVAAVNEFLTRGYAAQKDELNTVAGRWKELKDRMGDAWEEVGKAIAQNDTLSGALAKASEKVKALGGAIAKWVGGGGVARMADTFKNFGVEVRHTFSSISEYAKFGILNAWESVKWFGSASQTTFRNVASIVENTWKNATDTIGYHLARLHAKATGQEWNIAPPNLRDVFEGVEEIPEKSKRAAQELEAAMAQLDAERVARIKVIADAAVEAEEDVADAAKGAAAAEVAAQEKIEIARVNPIKAIEQEIKLAKEKMRIHGEMARKSIADILAEAKAREDAAKEWQKDEKKADTLRRKQAAGTRLSKKDAKWLAAFGQIEGARAGIAGAAARLGAAQQQFAAMKDQGEKLVDIKEEVAALHKDLTQLLERG